MATRIATTARNAAANAFAGLLDAGPAAGYIEIRTGTQPATANTAASGTLLGTCVLTDPAFGAASSGVVTAAAIAPDSTADATGTAGWFRAYDSTGAAVIDGSCGTSGADMNLDSVSIVAGGTITVNSWTVTMPAA